ncbi:MAG: nicotinate-nucleotide adenylyltransferase [Chlamydiae bacterium]|nr:nicotinate-nucleotide adenylyltransferase [Chlamydiota bacterium]MBI3276437.1 nicotinate-nucleotide adenylyltransferase [Chlamydiota bacterium]
MRIGLFGGTFDPIHMGHLVLAEQVREEMRLDKIIFIPSAHPPHKKNETLSLASRRLKMVELAIQGNSGFEVSRIELDRKAPSYSLDTVKAFKKKYPKDSLFFILGSDSLFGMYHWYRVEELIQLCHFVIVPRPGFSLEDVKNVSLHLSQRGFKKVTRYFVRMPEIGISSTEVRKKVAGGLSVRYLVPEKVFKFIQRKKLYIKNKDLKSS